MGISNQQKKKNKKKTSTNVKRNKQGKSELSLFSYTAQRVREREGSMNGDGIELGTPCSERYIRSWPTFTQRMPRSSSSSSHRELLAGPPFSLLAINENARKSLGHSLNVESFPPLAV